MSDFARVVPGSVYIKSMTTSSQADMSLKLTISAEARSSEGILEWIETMKAGEKFKEIE